MSERSYHGATSRSPMHSNTQITILVTPALYTKPEARYPGKISHQEILSLLVTEERLFLYQTAPIRTCDSITTEQQKKISEKICLPKHIALSLKKMIPFAASYNGIPWDACFINESNN